jgi:hypothetical protein
MVIAVMGASIDGLARCRIKYCLHRAALEGFQELTEILALRITSPHFRISASQ